MDKYKQLLAAQVLNDGKNVSYRALSRELKVHSGIAKQMLFSFHQTQNAKKTGSCHATYIISGIRSAPTPTPPRSNGTHSHDGDDTVMRSSPPMSSLPDMEPIRDSETVNKKTILLVREEHLAQARKQFESITSIFVYSLGPSSVSNLNVLSDCNREMHERHAKEDPLETWRQYGTIQNPKVRRRTGKRPVAPPQQLSKPPQSVASSTKQPVKKPEPSERAAKAGVTDGTAVRESAGAHAGSVADLSTSKVSNPTLKRERSNIMASFNKAKLQEKKNVAPDPKTKDEPMLDASDNEEELEPIETTKASGEQRKARSEREADLRKMMEDSDDDNMEDAPSASADADADSVSKQEEVEDEEEESAPIDRASAPKPKDEDAHIEVSGGRRRGKRRVMKKRTMKDEEGYLVTREEAVWESFSEDEPAPKKQKPLGIPAQAQAQAKGKKGQGNIMNFFGKR